MPLFHLVDAFTDSPFAGNPAGVVLLDDPAPEDWMRMVAREVNASETAFLAPEDGGWSLRWFTPTVEVDLCGHATLASAHVLWSTGTAAGELDLHTRSGHLRAVERDGWIWLDLPARPVVDHEVPDGLDAALRGVAGTYLGRSQNADGEPGKDVVELADERSVRELDVDLDAILGLGGDGLLVTAAADGAGDLVARYFAPNVGIAEDPVTGSAYCTLGPLWASRLGRHELEARQVSARGGRLFLRVGDTRVEVGGHAVTVITGEVTGP